MNYQGNQTWQQRTDNNPPKKVTQINKVFNFIETTCAKPAKQQMTFQ